MRDSVPAAVRPAVRAARSAPRKVVVRQARAQRVGDILDSARTIFSERGYENTTMAEIAARAGVVEGSVYKYFESKRELLLQVIEAWYEGLVDHLAHDLAGIKGTRSRLRYLVWQHVVTIRRDPQLSRLMFQEVRLKDDYYRSPLHEKNRSYTQLMMDVVKEGIVTGEFRGDVPPGLVRDMVFGAIEHHTWNFLCGRGDLDTDRVADQVSDILCDGLAVRRAAESPALAGLTRETTRLNRVAKRLEALAVSAAPRRPVAAPAGRQAA